MRPFPIDQIYDEYSSGMGKRFEDGSTALRAQSFVF